jgi:hypothetical protein
MVAGMENQMELRNWKGHTARAKLTFVALFAIIAGVALALASASLLGVFDLAWRHWVIAAGAFLLLALVIGFLCGCAACLQLYKKRFALPVRIVGTLALLGLAGLFVFVGGFITLFASASIEEEAVERDGAKMLAEVKADKHTDVYYYDYKNWFIRAKDYSIHEWYGWGGYNPFKRDPMPKPITVNGERVDGSGNAAAPLPESEVVSAATPEYNDENEDVHAAFANEEEFLIFLQDTILAGYEKITDNRWIVQNDAMFISPAYLPAGFKHYDYPFAKDDPGIPGHTLYIQLWYSPLTFEILTVTQSAAEGPDSEGLLVFSDKFLDGDLVNANYPWASYIATYPIVRNGQSIYGFMLVRDESRKAECEATLASLGEAR